MNLKLSFSYVGLIVFLLPMLINVFYVLFPPAGEVRETGGVVRWVEITEKVSRLAYLFAIVFLVSRLPLSWHSPFLYAAICFLVLYYAVWIRYFAGGRQIELLGRPFLLVPMPLAVFPVLYYLCCAIWMHNIPAAALMVVFGAAHLTVSVQSFR